MKLLGDQRDDCGGVSGVQLAVGSHIRFKELADIDLLEYFYFDINSKRNISRN